MRTPISDREVVPPGPHSVKDVAGWRRAGYITPGLAAQLYAELPFVESPSDPSAAAIATYSFRSWNSVEAVHASGHIPEEDYRLAVRLRRTGGLGQTDSALLEG